MKDGFIKVAAASLDVQVADCRYNLEQVKKAVDRAEAEGVRVLVLPELCLTGYTCHDLFHQDVLLEAAWEALKEAAEYTEGKNCLTFVGLPYRYDNKLYNCAAALFDGELLGLIPKSFIPNYGEFYESRHFVPGPRKTFVANDLGDNFLLGTDLVFRSPDLPELTVGCEICEDLWAPTQPSQNLALNGATIIVNLSASPAVVGKRGYRRDLVAGQSGRLVCGYVYACASNRESTQDLVFSGHNIIAENGAVLAESQTMDPDFITAELDVKMLMNARIRQTTFGNADEDRRCYTEFVPWEMHKTELTRYFAPRPFVPSSLHDRAERCEEILSIQAAGLAKRLQHTHVNTAIVGLSGGLDSTLALLVMVRAADSLGWDRKRLWAVTMPCFGTTKRTRSNAELMALALGVSFREINIGASVLQHFKDLGLPEEDRSVTYENGQARERTQVLMDLSNLLNGMVIGTGDLSELALGWATYNGDHMSMYAVNASVPKTLVRHMVAYVAENSDEGLKRVLLDILDTPVSPELLPPKDGVISQITEDLVGPYELHDFFLYHMVRRGCGPAKIYRMAKCAFRGTFDDAVILKWLKIFCRRFFQQQFKRSCLPDGPKVGSVTLSPRGDWRMPSDAAATLWLREAESLE